MTTPQTDTNLSIQYQLANGSWIDAGPRASEFIGRAAAMHGHDQVRANLAAGKPVTHDTSWYGKIRRTPEKQAAPPPIPARAPCNGCGETSPSRFTTIASGNLCDDCI